MYERTPPTDTLAVGKRDRLPHTQERDMQTIREIPTDPYTLAQMLENVADDHTAPEDVGPLAPNTAVIDVEHVAVKIGSTYAIITRRVIRSAPRPA